MHLCIFEDQTVKNLHPLTYLNPVFELRCGCTTLREKIINLFPFKSVSLFTRAYLTEYVKETFPDYRINALPEEDTLFINGRVVADDSLREFITKINGKEIVAVNEETVVAAFVKRNRIKALTNNDTETGLSIKRFSSIPSEKITSRTIRYSWDLITLNGEQIENDFLHRKQTLKQKPIAGNIYPGAILLNKKNIVIGKGSSIKPGVVLDAEHGHIIIGKNVTIMPNAVIEGPAYIGDDSTIKIGAKIYPGTSIGSHCKIGGEVTRSIFQSYSNKAHDGFVGDSYIGSWVNLGADTNTSNLKNTYGEVTALVNGTPVHSGQQFLGLTMGDHSKSGINVMFNTGSFVGISSNIYGADFPPKFIPSFSWGSPNAFTIFDIEKSIEVARRIMERRGITMSSAYESMMRYVFNQTKQERKRWKKK